jgi:hypothetical protein
MVAIGQGIILLKKLAAPPHPGQNTLKHNAHIIPLQRFKRLNKHPIIREKRKLLLLLGRNDRWCERSVVVSFWFKRVAAASDPGQNTLQYKGHGLFKPSVSAKA